MRHATIDDLQSVADVQLAQTPSMSRQDRLRRWASLLDEDPTRFLRPLYRVELYADSERDKLRGDNTPLSVAYADPVLRREGLGSDRLGDSGGFFDLTPHDMHLLVCDCRYGGFMRAGDVAKRLRALTHPNPIRRVWARLWL